MIPGHVTHQSTCLQGSSQQESHRRRHTGTTPTVKVSPRHLVLLLLSEEVSHERSFMVVAPIHLVLTNQFAERRSYRNTYLPSYMA